MAINQTHNETMQWGKWYTSRRGRAKGTLKASPLWHHPQHLLQPLPPGQPVGGRPQGGAQRWPWLTMTMPWCKGRDLWNMNLEEFKSKPQRNHHHGGYVGNSWVSVLFKTEAIWWYNAIRRTIRSAPVFGSLFADGVGSQKQVTAYTARKKCLVFGVTSITARKLAKILSRSPFCANFAQTCLLGTMDGHGVTTDQIRGPGVKMWCMLCAAAAGRLRCVTNWLLCLRCQVGQSQASAGKLTAICCTTYQGVSTLNHWGFRKIN